MKNPSDALAAAYVCAADGVLHDNGGVTLLRLLVGGNCWCRTPERPIPIIAGSRTTGAPDRRDGPRPDHWTTGPLDHPTNGPLDS